MENQLPEKVHQPGTSLTISNETRAMAKVMVNVNMCLAYELDPQKIILWSARVTELAPDTTPEKMNFLLNCFMTEEIYWDKSIGIQNVFSGLKQVKWDEEKKKYIILKAIW